MSMSVRHALSLFALSFCGFLYAPPVAAQSPNFFITSTPGNYKGTASLRNNYTGFVGMEFTVNSPLYVTQLARNFTPNAATAFSQTHLVKLVNAQTGIDIPNGSVTLTPSSSFNNYYFYAPLAAPVLLQPNTSYLLLSQETAGGDSWYDDAPVYVAPALGTVTAAVYTDAGGNYIPAPNTAGDGYVGLNFIYSTTPPAPVVTITSPVNGSTFSGPTITFSANVTPASGLTVASVQFQIGDSSGNLVNFGPALTQAPYTLQDSTSTLVAGSHTLVVTATDSAGSVTSTSAQFYIASSQGGGTLISGFSGTIVRSNYSGFVGMKFAVGALPLTVLSLGRIGLPGNGQTHTLKLVNAATGQDVPGGAVSVTMTSGDGTTFQYAPLPSAVTLSANVSYLLLSQESSGGDTWYDYSPVTGVNSDASISGAVYSDSSGTYVTVQNTANYSYVPVNLTTSAASGGTAPGTISITSPQSNSFFTTGVVTFTASFAPTSGTTATSVQFVLDGVNYGSPITNPPYSLQVQSGLIDYTSHTLTAVGVDSGGNVSTSSAINFTVVQDTIPFIQTQTQAVATATSAGSLSGTYYGMQFTVGSSPLIVTRLGFSACCSFSSFSQFLKLVDATTWLDIPNGSVIATTSGYGGWGYSDLPAAVILQANKSYYLVGQGSPADFLLGPAVTPGAGAILNYPVYATTNNTYITATNLPGYSYAPVSFEYQSATPLQPNITITAPGVNSTVAGLLPVTFTTSAPTPLQVTSIQLKVDGANVGAPTAPSAAQINAGLPLGVSFNTAAFANGSHILTAVATDSQGTQGTSSPVNITISNAAGGPSSSPAFVTSFTPSYLRNNYSGLLGFSFTVGAVPLQVSSLGRICVAGNTGSHTVKLVAASNGSDVSGGSVSVALSGCTAGQFVYSALSSPITLPSASSYYLVDQETQGGDQWYDYLPIATASGATVNGVVYTVAGQYNAVSLPGLSYVPLNFLFASAPSVADPGFSVTLAIDSSGRPETVTATVTSVLPVSSVQIQIDGYNYGAPLTAVPYTETLDPVPNVGAHAIVAVARDSAGNIATSTPTLANFSGLLDVINFTGANPRNNYSGWVGFRLTTGNSGTLLNGIIQPGIASVGRLCVTGNSMLHIVKLVNASTGVDVPNAMGWINMAGCTTGSYVDAILPGTIALAANTSYYLVSREYSGGDLWFDQSPAVPLATVSTPVLPTQAETGLYAIPTGANFTIDGPAYTAADGSYVFGIRPNYSFVGLSIGGYSVVTCRYGGVCGP